MNAKRIFQSLILCGLAVLMVSPARAQGLMNPQAEMTAHAATGGTVDILDAQKKTIAGAWATKVTPPPDSGEASFPGCYTFASDGNLIATQAGGAFPALGNPQLGLWEKSGARQFTFTYFLQEFDDHFQLVDTAEVHALITLGPNGDQFTGSLDFSVFDLDGNLLFNGCCATIEGKRLELKAPNLNGYRPDSAVRRALNNDSQMGNREWGWGSKRNIQD